MKSRSSISFGLTLALAFAAGCAEDADNLDPDPDVDPAEVHHGTIVTSAGEMDVDYQIVDGNAVIEGDLLIPWSDFVHRSDARAPSATVTRNLLWSQGVVPFVIDLNLPDQARVTDAIRHWQERTAIRFVPRTTEPDFVRFVDGVGCSSWAGRTGNQQLVTLGAGCGVSAAIHEIGHAIGLWHEQSRQDRDGFVAINWGNIPSNQAHNFNKYGAGWDIGTYDTNSIMHYSSFAFAINPSVPTITRLDGSLIGGASALSPGDLIGVEWLYGPPFQIGRAVARGLDGRLDVFAKGTDHQIWHAIQTSPGGAWGGWGPFGGSVRSTPTVARNLDGRLEMFAVGWDNHVYHQWQTWPNGTWSGWGDLGGSIKGLPIVSRHLDGRLEVFGLATDNSIKHIAQTAPNGGWGTWQSFFGNLKSNPAVGQNLDGRLDVFAIAQDNTLWHVAQTAANGGWGSWQWLGSTPVKGTPAVGRNLDGRLELFATGTDDRLKQLWQVAPSGGWSGWWNANHPVLGSPAIGRNNDGRLEVVAVDWGGSTGHIWQTSANGSWSGWSSYGGTTSTRMPDVGVNEGGRQQAFVVGVIDKVVYETSQIIPSGGWGSWFPIGGITVVPELGTI